MQVYLYFWYLIWSEKRGKKASLKMCCGFCGECRYKDFCANEFDLLENFCGNFMCKFKKKFFAPKFQASKNLQIAMKPATHFNLFLPNRTNFPFFSSHFLSDFQEGEGRAKVWGNGNGKLNREMYSKHYRFQLIAFLQFFLEGRRNKILNFK